MSADAILDGAVADVQVNPAESESANNENSTLDKQATEGADQPKSEAPGDPVVEELRRQLAKERRRIGKLTGDKYRLKAELDQRSPQSDKAQGHLPQTERKPPRSEDFEGRPFEDLLAASAKFYAEQATEERFTESARRTQEQTKLAESQQWKEERLNHFSENEREVASVFPDYTQLVADYYDVLEALPQSIKDVVLESDRPAFAVYAMSKDGSLEQLAGMSPTRAAAVIALAEQRALAMKAPVTRAPAPLAAAKGTAPGKKSLDQMSPEELKAWWSTP